MEIIIKQDISWQPEAGQLLHKLRIPADPADEDYQEFMEMLAQASQLARPKYAYAVAAIEEKLADAVLVEGILLKSQLVRENLDQTFRIIPYLATCGRELDDWSRQYDDFLANYWADEIKNQALRVCIKSMRQTVRENYFTGQDMSQMSPGSLPQWPINGQKELFLLMQEALPILGIELTDSYLMLPAKSVSGFHFSSKQHFENCAMCPRLVCPERRAVYQAARGH